jgi:hypothetical protein
MGDPAGRDLLEQYRDAVRELVPGAEVILCEE